MSGSPFKGYRRDSVNQNSRVETRLLPEPGFLRDRRMCVRCGDSRRDLPLDVRQDVRSDVQRNWRACAQEIVLVW